MDKIFGERGVTDIVGSKDQLRVVKGWDPQNKILYYGGIFFQFQTISERCHTWMVCFVWPNSPSSLMWCGWEVAEVDWWWQGVVTLAQPISTRAVPANQPIIQIRVRLTSLSTITEGPEKLKDQRAQVARNGQWAQNGLEGQKALKDPGWLRIAQGTQNGQEHASTTALNGHGSCIYVNVESSCQS